MAVSTISILTSSQTLTKFNPKSIIKFQYGSSSSTSSLGRFHLSLMQQINFGNGIKQAVNVGLGLLASSMVALTPMDANATRIEYFATVGDPPCEFRFAPSGLGYCDVAVGYGEEAPYGELINIHYTARFADGTVFDSSYKRARYLTIRIGVGKVIEIVGKVRERRINMRLIILC